MTIPTAHRDYLSRSLAMFLVIASGVSLASEELSPTVLVEGLNNPTSVALQPETGTVFVVESGAGKIVRIKKDGDGESDYTAEPVVIGFPEDTYGKGPTYKIGPLSIAFLDKSTLVIGGGGNPDGEERVYVVEIPEPDGNPVNVESAESFEPLAATPADGDQPEIPGEGNFFNVVLIENQVYATSNGDDEKGWIARGTFEAKKPTGALERFIATKPGVKVNAPAAITKTPNDNLLVGQMGTITDDRDSFLTFYDRKNGKSLMSLPIDLRDVVSLQYGPVKEPYKKSHLYALDYAWAAPKEGQLVRLDAKLSDDGKQQVAPVKLASLIHPTSMAFGLDGELYVTLLSSIDGADQPDGKLIKFKPGL